MRKISFLLFLFFLSTHLAAQKSFGTVILGLESGFDVAQFTDGLRARMSPGLQAELSLGRVSLGAGIGWKFYPEYEYYSFTGETVQREVNGALLRFYLADLHVFSPKYWTVPLKLDVRIHRCDCVYLHAGLIFNNIDLKKPDQIRFAGAEFDQQYNYGVERSQLMKHHTKTFEFGVGFNVFRRQFFRLVARPAYVLSENPEIYGDSPKWLPTLRFTFGAQFALWRE